VVKLLLDDGAQINRDLMSSLQLKVNILVENAEAGMVLPDAVEAWQQFLSYMVTAQLCQHLPEIVAQLSAEDREDREAALTSLKSASYRGLDVSAAAPQLLALTDDPGGEIRYTASQATTMHTVRHPVACVLEQLYQTGDPQVKAGLASALVSAAEAGLDVTPGMTAILSLLTDATVDLRHDGAIALGYAATHGHDVAHAVPDLMRLLADPEPAVRRMGAWALYRVGKYLGAAAPAIPALQALAADPDEDVRNLAEEALRAAGG